MKALESINTGQWSNIPPCIVQSINILVEQSRMQSQQLESIKSQFSDLSMKVSAKNQKFEYHIDDLQASFANHKTSAAQHWKDFENSLLTVQDALDRYQKTAQSHYNELKSRMTHSASEQKKHNKEVFNKLDAMNEQVEESIVVRTERAKVDLEENLKEFVSKYIVFASGIEEVVGSVKDNQVLIEEKISGLSEKLGMQTSLLVMNENSLNSFKETVSKLMFKNQKHKTSIKDLHIKVENLANESESEILTPDSAPSPTIHINPVKDRVEKLEKALESFELASKLAQEKTYYHIFQENKKLENSLKDWTKVEMNEKIETFLGESKKKLDWIPTGCESMKGMSVTEARIFILESRIRQEENSRIVEIQKLEDELKSIQRPRSVSGHKNSKTICTPVEDRVLNFPKTKIVNKRPSSSLGYREGTSLGRAGLREKFRIKVNDLFL